jgi:ribosome-binding factor A
MRPYKRADRIASLIKDALSEALVFAVNDPRVHNAVVTHVSVAPDMSVARVYVRSLVSTPESREELLTGLKASRSFLRGEVGRKVYLQRTPALDFFYDDQEDEAAAVDVVLDRLARERPFELRPDAEPEAATGPDPEKT